MAYIFLLPSRTHPHADALQATISRAKGCDYPQGVRPTLPVKFCSLADGWLPHFFPFAPKPLIFLSHPRSCLDFRIFSVVRTCVCVYEIERGRHGGTATIHIANAPRIPPYIIDVVAPIQFLPPHLPASSTLWVSTLRYGTESRLARHVGMFNIRESSSALCRSSRCGVNLLGFAQSILKNTLIDFGCGGSS